MAGSALQFVPAPVALRAESETWPRPPYAWYVVTVLVLIYAFATLDRVAIGLMVEPIKADLGISDTQVGLLQGFAFAVFYALFGIPIGILVDRRRRVRLLAASLALWSFATIGCGLATSFLAIFIARVGVGAGEAAAIPASSSLIADLFPPEKRSKAFGVFLVGSSIGTALAYVTGSVAIAMAPQVRALSPALSAMPDWQIVFFVIGIPGALLSLLLLATVREPARRETKNIVGKFSFAPMLRILAVNRRAYAGVMGSAVLNVLMVAAQVGWLPSFFIRVHGWTASEVGTRIGLLAFPFAASSAITAGWLIAWLYRRGRIDAPLFVILGQSLAWGIFGPMMTLTPSATLSLVFFVCNMAFGVWASVAALAALSQITPNELRGQIIALYMVAYGLVALTAGGLFVGLLNDHLFTGPAGVGKSLALVDAGAGAGAMLLVVWGLPAFRRAAEQAKTWSGG